MKDKLTNGCVTLALLALAAGAGWLAVSMFRQGAWIKGLLLAMGALLFAAPLLAMLFSKPVKTEPEQPQQVRCMPLPTDPVALTALARQVAGEDEALMQAVKESLADPDGFYKARSETDAGRDDDYYDLWETYRDEPETLRSVGLLYMLDELKAIAGFDYKTDWDNFAGRLKDLQRVQRHHLPVEVAQQDGMSNVTLWCHRLNEKWRPLGYEPMLIDADSDEYWVAVVPAAGPEAAREPAPGAGKRG